MLDNLPSRPYTVGVGRVCPVYRFPDIQICSLPTPTVYHMRMHRVNIYFYLFLGARCRGCMDIPEKNVASSAPLQMQGVHGYSQKECCQFCTPTELATASRLAPLQGEACYDHTTYEIFQLVLPHLMLMMPSFRKVL
jgi:hypothetical protein